MRLRILVSAAIGLASGSFCWFLLARFHQQAGDFTWAIKAARDLLAGRNPYETADQLYPLTAAVFGLPFLKIPLEVAGGIFYGISSGLLAFGLSKNGYSRLLVFAAYPYWSGLLAAQWIPLLMASAFFPLLLPVTLAKPQIGLPVAATHPSRRGIIGCAVLLLLTVAFFPRWPLLWIHQLGAYNRFFPLLTFPGMVLLLALWRYRDRDAWLLLLAAAMPQRWFYDQFILWLIPKTRREIIWTAFVSWGAGIWRWYHTPASFTEVGRWTVVFIYLPMLVVLLGRAIGEREASLTASRADKERPASVT